MKNHYLHYLSERMQTRWGVPVLNDYSPEGTESRSLTYGELAGEIYRLHVLFEEMGIQEGDKIAIASRNCTNWAVAYLAIASYKAVVVSILQDFTPEDIHRLVEHSESKVLFAGPYVWKGLQNEEMPTLQAIISMEDFSLLRGIEQSQKAYSKWDEAFKAKYPLGVQPEHVHFPTDNIDDLALINYTSGSTGSPKGVMLSYRSMSNNVENALHILPAPVGGKIVSMLPLAHMFGQLAEFLYPICSGCEIYFLTKTPTPSILLKALQEVQPYIVVTVPLVIEKIFKKNIAPILQKHVIHFCWSMPIIGNLIRNKVKAGLNKAFGGNVIYFLCGGAAINPEVEKCLKDIRFPISVGYGMTECGPLISGNNPKIFVARSGGAPVPNMKVKIDSESPDKVGEVLVKGENVMMGYYKNEEATKAVFTEDGWMRTGDLGTMDKRGNVFLRGRNKTMLLGPSGQNIYPEEIEDKLNNMNGVVESVVVEREGKLVALIFPDYHQRNEKGKRLTLQELQDMMKENIQKLNKLIPNYSQISKVEVVENEFEKTPKKSIKRFLYK